MLGKIINVYTSALQLLHIFYEVISCFFILKEKIGLPVQLSWLPENRLWLQTVGLTLCSTLSPNFPVSLLSFVLSIKLKQ